MGTRAESHHAAVVAAVKKKPPLTGRARKDAVMPRALEIGASGSAMSFKHVCELMKDDGAILKLWASATDRDAIERAILKARAAKPRR